MSYGYLPIYLPTYLTPQPLNLRKIQPVLKSAVQAHQRWRGFLERLDMYWNVSALVQRGRPNTHKKGRSYQKNPHVSAMYRTQQYMGPAAMGPCIRMYLHVFACIRMYIYVCVCMCVCMYSHACIRMYAHVFACIVMYRKIRFGPCIEYMYRGARSIHVFGIGEIH